MNGYNLMEEKSLWHWILTRDVCHKILFYRVSTNISKQKLKILYYPRVSSQKLEKISFVFNNLYNKPPIYQTGNICPNVCFVHFVWGLVTI